MDILTADGLYHLNNVKIQSEPTHPNNNPSSIPEDFQKLLADKSFEPISCDKATKNGGVVPRLNQTIVPDATIGNIPRGRGLVTTMFDNGQVMIDYITDCLPTGDAWMRVHAGQLNNSNITPPVLFNLNLPERYSQDSRWSTVRNTPLRKSIETIGSGNRPGAFCGGSGCRPLLWSCPKAFFSGKRCGPADDAGAGVI